YAPVPRLPPSPTLFPYTTLFRSVPVCRRMGIATQLMEAVHSWVSEHEYASIRFECHNQHRPMLHLAIAQGYDVVGIRWDPDRERSEEHTSELQSRFDLVCRLLLE